MGKTVPQARSSDAEGTITIMAEMCTAYNQKRGSQRSAGLVELEQVCDVARRKQMKGFERHQYDLVLNTVPDRKPVVSGMDVMWS